MADDGPIVPPATIGMIGGGQLGKYALVAANAMGYRTVVVDPDPDAPAGVVAHRHIVAAYDDAPALAQLAATCSVVTTEFENASSEALARLAESVRVAPAAASVAVAQDRVVEKTFMVDRGIPVGPFAPLGPISNDAEWEAARRLATAGAIIKTARLGYDGKGQRSVDSPADLDTAFDDLGRVDCVVEQRLAFDLELSVILARTADGRHAVWDVAENVHVDGILDVSVVPARVDAATAERARRRAAAVADALDYVGVLAVEMFVLPSSGGAPPTLLVNEIAPRPHNSGHWTIDAAVTSQFEQQIRAVCGVGLGDTAMTAPAVAMVNLLGDLWLTGGAPVEPDWAAVLADPTAALHLYGKREPRRARKMGHLTVTATTSDEAEQRARSLRALL